MEPPADDAGLVRAARRLLVSKGWDVVVCLTDFPLHVHRRPVVAHANPVRNVAIVSVPALGAVGTRPRLRETIVRLLERLIGFDEPPESAVHGGSRVPSRSWVERVRELGTDPDEGAFAYTARVVTGNLVLLGGMVAANQPWRLSLRLSRALTGAVAVGILALVTSDIWRLSDAFDWSRLTSIGVLSVGATTTTLVVGGGLWESVTAPGSRKQVALFNIATVVTVVIGVSVLYVVLFVLALLAAYWLVVPKVFHDAVGHSPTVRDYLELAWLTGSLAMVGGALGAALESDAAVADAAYAQRSATPAGVEQQPPIEGLGEGA
jgi:hypothetical protein